VAGQTSSTRIQPAEADAVATLGYGDLQLDQLDATDAERSGKYLVLQADLTGYPAASVLIVVHWEHVLPA
jgi:hypothetical protein